jgi:hypothetical protein
MESASKIIKYSKAVLSTMSIQKIGKVVSTIGSTAQCMAQATDVVIPKASQLIRKLIAAKIRFIPTLLQQSCK